MWKELKTIEEVDQVIHDSCQKPQIIFKHSTRCSVSDMAKARVERSIDKLSATADCYYLDLIAYRPVSNYIAECTQVVHQSPQLLLLMKGECVLEQTHYDILVDEVLEILNAAHA